MARHGRSQVLAIMIQGQARKKRRLKGRGLQDLATAMIIAIDPGAVATSAVGEIAVVAIAVVMVDNLLHLLVEIEITIIFSVVTGITRATVGNSTIFTVVAPVTILTVLLAIVAKTGSGMATTASPSKGGSYRKVRSRMMGEEG